MAKKKAVRKKRASKKKTTIKKVSKKLSSSPTNQALTQNMISLQKVLLHVSEKLNDLTVQTSKLLELFEISAKTLATKEIEKGKGNEETKKILEKIENLSEQNKIIARGLTLLHEPNENPQRQQFQPQRLPQPSMRQANPQTYQKSISTEEPIPSVQEDDE